MRRQIILASASPRRKALLEAACFDVDVRPSGADETWPDHLDITAAAIDVARRKLPAARAGHLLALAADTVVVHAGEPLGKPADATQARQTLRRLSGSEHQVITGFVVCRATREIAMAVTTRVGFRDLTESEIERYIATDEPFDKAGSYAIQGMGGALVAWLEGSYTNVVGLPLPEVLTAVDTLS